MHNKDLVNYQSGYEHLAVFGFVLVIIISLWVGWISSCERRALKQFDKAIGIEASR